MSYHFIDRKDPHIDAMLRGFPKKLEKMLLVLEEIPRAFNGGTFLTDEELSNVCR